MGFGYTVEGQKTGEEKYGGLQMEIIPGYRRRGQKWLAAAEEDFRHPHLYYSKYESKTPAQLGMTVGAKVRLYPSPPSYDKPVEVGDLIQEREDSCIGVAYLEVRPHI